VRPGASTRRAARCRLLRLRCVSGCLDTSRGSLHRSSSTTSPTPRVRVPRHIAWLVTRLVVDYFASRRLVVDYFTYATRPGASAHLAIRHAARRRLLHLSRASGCFGSSRGLSCDSSSTNSPRAGSSSTTSPTPRVRVPRHAARRQLLHLRRASGCFVASRGLSRDSSSTTSPRAGSSSTTSPTPCVRVPRHAARRQLLHLRRASGCFVSSLGLSRDSSSTTSPRVGSSSTTSPTPCVRVPRHVAGLVTRLVVDYSASCRLVVVYFDYEACPVASARCAGRRVARCRLLRLRRSSGCLGSSRGSL
jgi:hypothetical protein